MGPNGTKLEADHLLVDVRWIPDYIQQLLDNMYYTDSYIWLWKKEKKSHWLLVVLLQGRWEWSWSGYYEERWGSYVL